MVLLLLGIAIIISTGLTYTLFPQARRSRSGDHSPIITIIGVLAGIGLIITGMLTVELTEIWDPPFWAILIPVVTMPFVFILVISTLFPTKIKLLVQHPILVGVLVWSCAHLTINGDLASIVLFGSFGIFSLINMVILYRRGELRSASPSPKKPKPIPRPRRPKPTKKATQDTIIPIEEFVARQKNHTLDSMPVAARNNLSAKAFAKLMAQQDKDNLSAKKPSFIKRMKPISRQESPVTKQAKPIVPPQPQPQPIVPLPNLPARIDLPAEAATFTTPLDPQVDEPVYYDIRAVLIGLTTFVVVLFFHSFLFNISQN